MFEDLKIGIIGGGQLGAMLLRHAIDFGLNVSVIDKDSNAPCSKFTSSFVEGDPLNYQDLYNFGLHLDIITLEKEAVNVKALKDLEKIGKKIFPSPSVIEIIQDKFLQKEFLLKNNLPVVSGTLVKNKEELKDLIHKFPACLKKCQNGYDGKGVMILKTSEDIEVAFNSPSVLEDLIDIKHEISVIVSRNSSGVIECYDPVLMIFNKQRMLLDFQICPADIDKGIAIEACNLAVKTAEAFDLVGIMAVEMFLDKDNKLLINELAPRPHNSGHHTIESCKTSQFEQQIRIILGLNPGSTDLLKPSAMINIIEPASLRKNTIYESLKTILCTTDIHLHWYGKKSGIEGRKMGHITLTDDDIEKLKSKAIMIKHLLYESNTK